MLALRVDDDADAQAEEIVELPHPLGVALGEVVVHGDDVDAFALERVEVAGQRRHERLAFARAHLGDRALVEDHAADELHVVVAHLERALARLTADGERLVQDVVEGRALSSFCLNSARLGFELGVVRAAIAASSALMASTRGLSRLISRS